MLRSAVLALGALCLAQTASAGMYTKNGPVVVLEAKTFKKQILELNTTSIVEFYAPWCGHCKNLAPAYVKAAENLKGIATVAAIDCDEDANKQFCGEQGVKGFPTLKTFRPNAKLGGNPTIEDYNGPRTAKGVVDWVLERLPNHVARVTDDKLDGFLQMPTTTPKAILFTNKGTTSALYKALAIDFLGSISFAQVRDKEKASVEKFGITKFPTLILLPGGDKESVVYNGDMKKEPLIEFLKQVAEPNKGLPDTPKPKKAKKSSSKASKSAASASSQASTAADEADSTSPAAVPKPKPTYDTTIPDIPDIATFVKTCLSPKSKTCILVITPRVAPVLIPLEETNSYLHAVNPSNFKFYQLPLSLLPAESKAQLGISSDEDQSVVVRAINGKRGWYIGFEGDVTDVEDLKSWADSVRYGEGKKTKFSIMKEPVVAEPVVEEPVVAEDMHDEL